MSMKVPAFPNVVPLFFRVVRKMPALSRGISQVLSESNLDAGMC